MKILQALRFMIEKNFIFDENLEEILKNLNEKIKLLSQFNNLEVKEIKNCLKILNPNNQKNQILKGITYGDFKYKNEQVEVFLHQRTSKKVKYKKREYSEIHPLNEKVIDEILREIKSTELIKNSVGSKNDDIIKIRKNLNKIFL